MRFFAHDSANCDYQTRKAEQNYRPFIDSKGNSVIPSIQCFYDVNMLPRTPLT